MQPIQYIPPTMRQGAGDAALLRVARDLEASFLSVMLKDAGVGAPRGDFGGGPGEAQFASFLTDAYAARLADRGGIGLAQVIYSALKDRANAAV